MALYRLTLLTCLFSCVLTQQSDPCGQISCQMPGYECRLLRVSCADGAPCAPQPICIPSQTKMSSCSYGQPVLDQSGQEMYTPTNCDTVTNNCPHTTDCQTRLGDPTPVCCWTPFKVTRASTDKPLTTRPTRPGGQVPGYCAETFPLPALFCQWLVPECTGDRDCLPGSKCCHTDTCGRKGCLLARLQPECSFIDKMFGLCK